MPPKTRLHHVARTCGFSVATVSRALAGHAAISETTRRKVRDASRKLRYRRSRAGTARVTLVAVQRQAPSMPFPDDLFSLALTRAAANPGMVLMLRLVQEHEDTAILEALHTIAGESDGLLLYGYVNRAILQSLSDRHIRYVVIGNPVDGIQNLPASCAVVTSDMVEMGRVATARLTDKGFRRIAFICHNRTPGMYNDSWLMGYQLAHVRAGLPMDAELQYIISERERTPAAKTGAALWPLESPPDAWVLPNLALLPGVRKWAQQQNWRLDPGNTVLGGRYSSLIVPFVAEWPMVAEDSEAMVDAACSIMTMLLSGQGQAAAQIMIPYKLCEGG